MSLSINGWSKPVHYSFHVRFTCSQFTLVMLRFALTWCLFVFKFLQMPKEIHPVHAKRDSMYFTVHGSLCHQNKEGYVLHLVAQWSCKHGIIATYEIVTVFVRSHATVLYARTAESTMKQVSVFVCSGLMPTKTYLSNPTDTDWSSFWYIPNYSKNWSKADSLVLCLGCA